MRSREDESAFVPVAVVAGHPDFQLFLSTLDFDIALRPALVPWSRPIPLWSLRSDILLICKAGAYTNVQGLRVLKPRSLGQRMARGWRVEAFSPMRLSDLRTSMSSSEHHRKFKSDCLSIVRSLEPICLER